MPITRTGIRGWREAEVCWWAMDRQERVEQDAAFVRMSHMKTRPGREVERIGDSLVTFYKGTVQRTRKFAGIGEVWDTLIPPELNEHCCLEGYRAGTLTVLVDSSPHLYRLKQLLLENLQKQIMDLCRAQGLKKIALRPGRWYTAEGEQDRKVVFDH